MCRKDKFVVCDGVIGIRKFIDGVRGRRDRVRGFVGGKNFDGGKIVGVRRFREKVRRICLFVIIWMFYFPVLKPNTVI